MCGIAGIVSFDDSPVARSDIAAMCGAMAHRGPDDEGVYVAPGVGLGMRRLSIIDLATGHQPICNEDGSIWAVLNGEIYNYRELRNDLVRQGHRFATSSDTETIVHSYEDMHTFCVEGMRGMFAFAVWDERRRMLLLARDRLGIKPLYFTFTGRRLAFASELKSLLELDDVERRIDLGALNHLLTFMTTPREQSIVAGVRKLPPGHLLVAAGGKVHIEPYWDVQFAPGRPDRAEDLVDELRTSLEESVRLHMVSDVPVGAFLSGGLDSSTVVAMMARESSRPVKTFSVGFHERDFDELQYARQVARAFGTDHHETILEPNVLPCLEDLVWHLDEPFGDSSAIPTYVVSKLARAHVKVVLSGDGGDELFGGYDKYVVEQNERRFDRLPGPARALLGRIGATLPRGAPGRRFLRHRALTGPQRYLDAGTLFSREERLELLHPDVVRAIEVDEPTEWAAARLARPGQTHWLSSLQSLDLDMYLPLDILTKVDRMSMACSLEARVPLLDHKVVELAARIPPSLQLRGGTTKYLLKRAMQGILPQSIIERPKRGFAVPLGRWFRGQLSHVARDLLLCPTSHARGLLSPGYLRRLLDSPRRDGALDLQTWTLLSLELWCRQFLDRAPRNEAVPLAAHVVA